jgi:hypothetical protein
MPINVTVLTAAGARAVERAIDMGVQLTFTRVAAGDGNPASGFTSRTALASPKVFGTYSSRKYSEPKSVTVKCDIEGADVAETFTMNEIGLYCADPETLGAEILMLYGCLSSNPENTPSVIEAIEDGGLAVKRFFVFNIELISEAAALVRSTYTEKVTIGEMKELKDSVGWLKNIITLPPEGYEAALSGLMKSQDDNLTAILDRFDAGVLKVGHGGTGASTAQGARESLEVTPENIGAAIAGHTHAIFPTPAGSSAGLMTALDKLKLDGFFTSESGRWVQLIAELPETVSTAYGPMCTDGLYVFLPFSGSSSMDAFNVVSKSVDRVSLGTSQTYFCCCTDGDNVYVVHSAGLIVFRISDNSLTPVTFSAFTAYSSTTCCTDGVNVYIASPSNLLIYNIAAGTQQVVTIDGATVPGECSTNGVKVFRPYVDNGIGKMSIVDIATLQASSVTLNYPCKVSTTDSANAYLAGDTDFLVYDIATGSVTRTALAAPALSCRLDGVLLYITTSGLFEYVYNTATGVMSREPLQRACGTFCLPVVVDGAIYAAYYTGTAWEMLKMQRQAVYECTAFGPRLILFPLYSYNASDPFVYQSVFANKCEFAAAYSEDGEKAAVAEMTPEKVVFTVTPDKVYRGIAIGY